MVQRTWFYSTFSLNWESCLRSYSEAKLKFLTSRVNVNQDKKSMRRQCFVQSLNIQQIILSVNNAN